MITRYLTGVSAVFSPFARAGKTARTFLSMLPPNARSTMAVDVKLLGRAHAEAGPTRLALKFKDGKEMQLDLDTLKIRDIEAEVDRHSRVLKRQEELSGN